MSVSFKLYTSYFYQIRNFTEDMIPLSTAVWDPKWFHKHMSQSYAFIDCRGIYNGLRYEEFVPGENCKSLCQGKENCKVLRPDHCDFMKFYRSQLESVSIDKVIDDLTSIGKLINERRESKGQSKIDKYSFVFIVYESPYNLCSERSAIQDYFNSRGYRIEEWGKD